MKRIIALLLALTMLLSAFAMAEGTAAIMKLDNLRMETGGNGARIDGLECVLALDNVEDLPSLILTIAGEGQPLFTGVLQMTASQVRLGVSGMDHGYVEAIPANGAGQLAQLGDEGLAAILPETLPKLDALTLPPFTGIEIPQLDMRALLGDFMTGTDTFEIPCETIDALLEQALQLVRQQAAGSAQVDMAIQLLDQLRAGGTGFAIRGEIEEEDDGQSMEAGIYLANKSAVTGQKIGGIELETELNEIELSLSVTDGEGDDMEILEMRLSSMPDSARLMLDIYVMESASINFSLADVGGLQRAMLRFDTENGGDGMMEFAYGERAGRDEVNVRISARENGFALVTRTTMGADGVRTGEATLTVEGPGQSVELLGDLTMYTGGELDLNGFVMPADLRPANQAGQADDQALAGAFQPVMDYIAAHAVSDGE